jgi:hypothetical protein
MGSFNTTCAVSNSPIREGDEVRLFLLASKKQYIKADLKKTGLAHGCQCYPWDDFEVVGGFPLKAKYSDYNTYEFDEQSVEARFLMMILRQNYAMQTREEGKDYGNWDADFFDIEASALTWELVFEMNHRETFWFKGYADYNFPYLGIMAIHESVYQIMLNENYEVYTGYPEGEDWNTGYHPYENMNFQIALERELARDLEIEKAIIAKEYYEYFQDDVKSGKMTEDQMHERSMRMAEMRLNDRNRNRREYAFGIHGSIYNGMVEALSYFNEKNPEKVIEIDHIALRTLDKEASYFNNRMFARNIMYRPIMTSGQVHDLTADGQFWQQVGVALSTLNSEWEGEEHVETKKVSFSYQELHIDEIYQKLADWGIEDITKIQECIERLFNGTETDVVVTVEELNKPENKELKALLWNKGLDLHLSCAHKPK